MLMSVMVLPCESAQKCRAVRSSIAIMFMALPSAGVCGAQRAPARMMLQNSATWTAFSDG